MSAQRLRIVAFAWFLAFSSRAGAHDEVDLAVDTFLGCRAEIGYVLFFRLTNNGAKSVELPEDLLPWSPSSFAMEFQLKPDGKQAIQPAGIMADNWGRVSLQPRQELIGDIRLSLLFPGQHIDAALAAGDATLHWKYSAVLDKEKSPSVEGDIRLLGRSFYEKCKKGL